MANFTGTAGNDTLIGTASADNFDISQGGIDVVTGLAGDDIISAGAAFDVADQVDGGDGYDQLRLVGDYSAGMTLDPTTMRNVEEIELGAGFSYGLSIVPGNVAPGATLTIDGSHMSADRSLFVQAFTDGVVAYDGPGNDTFNGSTTFHIGNGGADRVLFGVGSFVIYADGAFSSDDRLEFQGITTNNSAELNLRGDYSAGLTITPAMIYGLTHLALTGDFAYSLSSADGAAVRRVDASGITGAGHATFDGSAETSESFFFTDSIGDDELTGGGGRDNFYATGGGSDVFRGNAEGDRFYMNGNLDSTDRILGGDGSDWLDLDGDYSAGIVFDPLTIDDVEALYFTSGHDYKVTTDDGNVGAGRLLDIQAQYLASASDLDFDGSAETDGSFRFRGGKGNDTFIGGAGGDSLDTRNGGADKLFGGGGDDIFFALSGFTSADRLDGGGGSDILHLDRDLTVQAQITRIETIVLEGGHTLTPNNASVAAGAHLTVDGSALGAAGVIHFDGSAELDGRFVLLGGAADDVMRGGATTDKLTGGDGSDKLIGGAGGDIETGGLGHDFLYGGADGDRFVFTDVAESTVAGADWIRDWSAGDRIDLSTIDANASIAGDQAFAFIGSSAFSAAGQLRAITTGSLNTIVSGDIDGDGAADFMVKVLGVQDLGVGSFVL